MGLGLNIMARRAGGQPDHDGFAEGSRIANLKMFAGQVAAQRDQVKLAEAQRDASQRQRASAEESLKAMMLVQIKQDGQR